MTNDEPVNQFEPSGHLAVETISELAAGLISADTLVRTHLHECASCRQRLRETEATIALFRKMPELDAPRAFTLPSPATRKSPAPSQSLSDRLFGWLQPAMPALRSAAVAAFLLFLSVTVAGNWVDDGDSPRDAAQLSEPTTDVQETAPKTIPVAQTEDAEGEDTAAGAGRMSEPTGAAESDSAVEQSVAQEVAPAPEAALDRSSSSAENAGASDDAPFVAGAMQPTQPSADLEAADAAGVVADESESAATPAIQLATPTPNPSPGAESQSSVEEDGWSLWQVAQVILLVASVILGALWLWTRRRASAV